MARAEPLKLWVSLLAAVSLSGVLAATTLSGEAGAQEAGCKGRVVLDAGHGGSDSGTVNAKYGLKEKDQTLDVARRLEALL
jgi:N-acetylmuramoyl-L-alanine amidase